MPKFDSQTERVNALLELYLWHYVNCTEQSELGTSLKTIGNSTVRWRHFTQRM